jgi:hypothetical protein
MKRLLALVLSSTMLISFASIADAEEAKPRPPLLIIAG